MKIQEYIDKVISLSGTEWLGRKIEKETTRDQILYGDPDQECTGIVTTIYASIDVIRKVGEKGYNFIIVHESLFWNHGDHTEWLKDNTAFQKKKELLDRYHICVWRFHDHMHAGIKVKDHYKDGIFYGLSSMMGWNEYDLHPEQLMPSDFLIPQTSVKELGEKIVDRFHLNGVRFIGNPDTKIRRIHLPMHILGRTSDNDIISMINDEDIDCLLTLEMVDFTVCEYIRDAGQLKEDKCTFSLGHFNFEEIGMEYYAEYMKENMNPDCPVCFIQAGDSYSYLQKGD